MNGKAGEYAALVKLKDQMKYGHSLPVKHICLILERVSIGLNNSYFFAVDFARLRAVIHCNMLPF